MKMLQRTQAASNLNDNRTQENGPKKTQTVSSPLEKLFRGGPEELNVTKQQNRNIKHKHKKLVSFHYKS